jgi:hypothetical protein
LPSVAPNGGRTRGQKHGDVFVGEQRSLVDRLARESQDAVLSQPSQSCSASRRSTCGSKSVRRMETARPVRCFLRVPRSDGFVTDLARTELNVGVLPEERRDREK